MNYFKLGHPNSWGEILHWRQAWGAVEQAAMLMEAAKDKPAPTYFEYEDYPVLGGWVRIHTKRVSYATVAWKPGDRLYYINREFLKALEESNAKEVNDRADGA